MSGPPVFSVVMPTHNGEAFVGRAVRSVLDQDFRDLELVVVDDGSTDSTLDVLARITDSRLTVVASGHRGVSAARNAGIRRTSGRYVAFLDSDDFARPNWLSSFIREIESAQNVGVVCLGIRVVDEATGEPCGEAWPHDGGTLFQDRQILFLAGSFAIERELLLAIGGYAEELAYSENTELGIRVVNRCIELGKEIRSARSAPVEYRVGKARSPIEGRSRHLARLNAVDYLLRTHDAQFRRDPSLMENHVLLAAVTAVRAGLPGRARRHFRRAITLNPRRYSNYLRLLLAFIPGLRSVVWR